MQPLFILQEGVDTSLNWLFFTLLDFMAVVVIVGSIAGWERGGADRKPNGRVKRGVTKARPAAKPQSIPKAKRTGSRKKPN